LLQNKWHRLLRNIQYILAEKQVEHIQNNLSEDAKVSWMTSVQLISNKNYWSKSQGFIFKEEVPFETADFSNDLRTNLRNISNARQKNKLVVFAGAGVSIDSGVPDWKELIEAFKSDINKIDGDYLEIAESHSYNRGKKEHIERLQEVVKYGKTVFNPIHEKIVELHPFHIITTNYDNHFEQVIEGANYRYSIIKKDIDLPYSKTNSLLIKMHGDIEEKNIVLSKKDYSRYSKNFPLIKGFVEGLFATQLVLFVGFSFDDPNLQSILGYVKKILGKNNQPPYLLLISPENYENSNTEEIEGKGVKVVKYENKPITKYFDQIKLDKDDDRLKRLSQIGQQVYKFLRVIEEYNIFDNDSASNDSVEQLLINSLSRFNGLEAIPTSVLTTIPPFKIQHQPSHNNSLDAEFDAFRLRTLNESLLLLLNPNNNKVENIEIPDFSKKNINNLIWFKSLDKLHSSGVFSLARKNDFSSPVINLNPNSDKDCNCLRCLYREQKYDELLETLHVISSKLIGENSSQNVGLLEAYGYVKTSQIIKAYYVLEKLKIESWKSQNYITYFLSNFNQKQLRSYLNYFNEKQSTENELQQIKIQIDKIDINKILCDLPIDNDVYNALCTIKDNQLFFSSQSIISEALSSIKEIYKGYLKEGYSSSGSNYWFNIQAQFYLLWNFYHQNLLYNDEDTEFKDLAYKYIEGMVASYATSTKYRQRLNRFAPFWGVVFYLYGRPKDLKKIMTDYKIDKLEFDKNQEAVVDLIKVFQSLCQSAYEQINIFREEVLAKPLFQQRITSSYFFEKKTSRIFNNLLILFCRIDLDRDQVNMIIDEGLKYLSVSPSFGYIDSHQYITDYIDCYIEQFSDDSIGEIVKYSLSENIWSGPFVKQICDAIIYKRKTLHFIGNNTYDEIIRRIGLNRKWSADLDDMVPFYQMLKPECQILFLGRINDRYSNDINYRWGYNPFYELHKWGVWSPVEQSDLFEFFQTRLLANCKSLKDYQVNDEGFPVGINDFGPWNEFSFFVSLVYQYDLFKDNSIQKIYNDIDSVMFKWALNPSNFDYDQFQNNWLLKFDIKLLAGTLKEIPLFMETVKSQLSINYNAKIAEIYFKCLCV